MQFARYLVRHNRIGLAGGVVMVIFIIMALLPNVFAPHDPFEMFAERRLLGPTGGFPLGNDRFGRDIASRIVYGMRASFQVGIVAVGLAVVIGTFLGLVAGYRRGVLDYLIMRVLDVLFAFPSTLLAISIVAVLGAGISSIVLAIGIVFTPTFGRVARAPVLSVKEREFVTAARCIGAGTPRILLRHILPNVLTPIMVQATLSLSGAIIVEAALSFLGLGAQPPMPSLGSMLSEGRPFMEVAPWVVLYPGLALALIVLGANLFGDAVRDMLDPRLRTEI